MSEEKHKIELVFLSLDMDCLMDLQNQIGDSSRDFKFSYLADKLEHLDQLEEYDVVVSPANSFGELKGGIDYYYYKLLGGAKFQTNVYNQIRQDYEGEIPIGCTMVVDIQKYHRDVYNTSPNQSSEFNNYSGKPRKLYMCPTMTIPMDVNGTRNAYLFMKTLAKTLRTDDQKIPIRKVLVPVPCVGVGRMNTKIVAKQIKVAIQASEGKGIIPAIFMTNTNEQQFRYQKLFEYQPDNVLQNARMACIQMTKNN